VPIDGAGAGVKPHAGWLRGLCDRLPDQASRNGSRILDFPPICSIISAIYTFAREIDYQISAVDTFDPLTQFPPVPKQGLPFGPTFVTRKDRDLVTFLMKVAGKDRSDLPTAARYDNAERADGRHVLLILTNGFYYRNGFARWCNYEKFASEGTVNSC
jgi:hypothetical protein